MPSIINNIRIILISLSIVSSLGREIVVLLGPNNTYFAIPIYKTTVEIYNVLPKNLNITIHCKSKDDDLGQHVIHAHTFYAFRFRVNFWETTLFFCRFTWKDISASFYIFDAWRDRDSCPTYCRWVTQGTALLGFLQNYDFADIHFMWKKGSADVSTSIRHKLGRKCCSGRFAVMETDAVMLKSDYDPVKECSLLMSLCRTPSFVLFASVLFLVLPSWFYPFHG